MRYGGGRSYDDDGEPEFLTYAELEVLAHGRSVETAVYERVDELLFGD